ncbi:MAG: hypothetical protein DBY09_06550 [Selenomonadales bacterium]|nr:MAG: hypothetical protein DBY09_06550 [Selenomonadales bacterium]
MKALWKPRNGLKSCCNYKNILPVKFITGGKALNPGGVCGQGPPAKHSLGRAGCACETPPGFRALPPVMRPRLSKGAL